MTTKTMNGEAHPSRVKPPPTDLELMMYVDGELDPAREHEVRQALLRDGTLRSKVSALELSASILRENVESSTSGFDLTDAVMAQIAVDVSTKQDPRDAAPGSLEALPSAGVDATAGLGSRAPSNDNARGIFALAALAVAAAAGLLIWGRMAPDASHPSNAPVAMVTTAEEAPMAATPTPPTEPRPAATDEAEEGDTEVGVEVAAVDFGTRIGTIFYVPTEAATSNHTTTVVWLADDPAGGEQ